ncbi:HyaD/HybD family hydrogenase maturation endopeptidase [Thiorhodococcus minor]|uniref:Hydrogenase maturation protease n=1 Tax=Thiorhodococcus minor TaxID=57489 RepID=A0A6M0JZM8_9GAMM|nr:HyaD/HybD family hydrogenase maturation endopeptidase [Thiorhodococcus minor]NEV62521.1 hydrogenase maturation protease [Thiorhodococcus minor]
MPSSTLILGLGNVLMTDEAVGAAVLKHLEAGPPPPANWTLMDGGTLSFTLAGPIGDAERLIVVDAAAMGDAPGTLRVFEGEAMDRQLRTHAKSVHEVSLADLMDMVRLTDQLPPQRALIGIEPEHIGWGEQLTPSVAAAVPRAATEIHALYARWTMTSPPLDANHGGIPSGSR